jgi:hypothetical protein
MAMFETVGRAHIKPENQQKLIHLFRQQGPQEDLEWSEGSGSRARNSRTFIRIPIPFRVVQVVLHARTDEALDLCV